MIILRQLPVWLAAVVLSHCSDSSGFRGSNKVVKATESVTPEAPGISGRDSVEVVEVTVGVRGAASDGAPEFMGSDQVVTKVSTITDSIPAEIAQTEPESVAEPAMISGAFLVCLPNQVTAAADRAVGCRFQSPAGQVQFVAPDFAITFSFVSAGQVQALSVIAVQPDGEWQWILRQPELFNPESDQVVGRYVVAEEEVSQVAESTRARWLPIDLQQEIDANARHAELLFASRDPDVFVCRGTPATAETSVHPGRYVPGEGCHIEWGYETGWLLEEFEVLVRFDNAEELSFAAPESSQDFERFMMAGRDIDGQILYVCKVVVQGMVYLGKTRSDWSDCRYSHNNQRLVADKYQIMERIGRLSLADDKAP